MVVLFMAWWKPKLEVKESISNPSKFLLSLVYQDLTLPENYQGQPS